MIQTLKKKKSKKIFFIKNLKENKKLQKTYNAKSNLFDIANDESFEKKKIAHIIKKIINKLQPFSWIFNINALSHMIDKITLFNNSLIRIKKRIIKIEKKKLYSNQINTIMI